MIYHCVFIVIRYRVIYIYIISVIYYISYLYQYAYRLYIAVIS